MKIKLKTNVERAVSEVFAGFNEDLFQALNPPFPPVRVLRFDGCQLHHETHLLLDFIFFKQKWISINTDYSYQAKEIFFVDEGKQLPFFLKYWKHKHLITIDSAQKTCIIDDITFKSPFFLLDLLLYPIMWLQFALRKPIYKKYFSSKNNITSQIKK